MRRNRRGALTLVVPFLLSSCYVTTQGYHLASDLVSARSVERYRRSDRVTEAEESFFQRVDAIRGFGAETLGLDMGRAFTTYIATDRDFLVSVVSAAGELSFVRKEWWFPIVGSVPYRGYYRPEGAARLAARLRRDGWDVVIRPVEAYSSLGFFRDPLYTYMMHYDESRLADLILHEMTHATLWIRNEVQFNEEFATFVGRQGARDFLEYIYGIDSPEVVRLDEAREESARYRKEIQMLRDRLERVYQQNIPDEEKRQQKATEIARFREYIAAHFSERFHSVVEINNAYIDLFTTYTGNIHLFEELHHQLGSNLAVTIAEVQRRVSERPPSAPAHNILSLDSTTRGIEN